MTRGMEKKLMDYQQLITFIMEMIGTVAFAASGAMVAVDRAMDIFGVIVLGVTTSVGGGAIRDVILGIVPPAMFQHPVYTLVATITSCVVFLILYLKKELLQGHNRETYDKVMLIMDSVGLGIFTVVGVNTGIAHGYMSWNHHRSWRWTSQGYYGWCAAIHSCKTYLCLCFDCRSCCLCASLPALWGSNFYGRSLGSGVPDPLSGSTLPLESAKIEKRRLNIIRNNKKK